MNTFKVFSLTSIFVLFCLKNAIVFKLCSVIGITSLVISISWIITDNIRRYLVPNKAIQSKGKSVLITGCDTGFGYETALRLTKSGWHVFATVLSETSEGAKQLQSMDCTIIRMDVTKDQDIANAYEKVIEECVRRKTKLWTVVNNAGVMTVGPIEWSTMNEFDRVFKTNVYGYIRIIRQFLPLIKKSRGRVVNISSCSALFTAPGVITYSMSKYAISSLSDGLRREMANTGVTVIEIIPQAYITQMTYNVLGILDRIWNESSPQIRRDFGDKYFQRFRDYIKYFNENTSNKLNQVLDPLIEAITFQRVYPKYLCCSPFYRLIMWSFNWLPVQWIDTIVPFCTFRATPDWVTDFNNNNVNQLSNL